MAVDETAEFSKAIEVALKMTNEADTLIVVFWNNFLSNPIP